MGADPWTQAQEADQEDESPAIPRVPHSSDPHERGEPASFVREVVQRQIDGVGMCMRGVMTKWDGVNHSINDN